tara:strand:- start:11003 stop:11341 length:339 start_codon:yes stop_codon:yes gene_type:complete
MEEIQAYASRTKRMLICIDEVITSGELCSLIDDPLEPNVIVVARGAVARECVVKLLQSRNFLLSKEQMYAKPPPDFESIAIIYCGKLWWGRSQDIQEVFRTKKDETVVEEID